MKKYTQYKCTDCHRTRETLVDNHRFTPDLCSITRGCEGRLLPIGSTSAPSISGSSVPVPRRNVVADVSHDIIDPISRGNVKLQTVFTTDNVQAISLLTGTEGQIVLAVRPVEWFKDNEINAVEYDALPDTLDVLFDTADSAPAAFTSFIFRKTQPFDSLSGKETGLEGKNLRYNVNTQAPDTVEVRVNGVLRLQGDGPDDYRIFKGNPLSDVAPNTIKFNTAINPVGITQVDVSVSKFAPRTTLTLSFRKQVERIESRVTSGAFENISVVDRFDPSGMYSPYQLYVVDLSSVGLPLNSVFAPAKQQFNTKIDFGNAFFLLAAKPFSHIDRYNTVVVDFKKFDLSNKIAIQYTLERQLKVNTLNVSLLAIGSVYPPLKFNKLKTETPIKNNLPGNSEQSIVDNDIIIGPDI